jgi:hypothetical protein
MSRARSLSWLPLSVVAALALAGCYGSTEPATNIGPESATLNARGTADKGSATSWFEYWETGSSQHRVTAYQHFPAGASGSFTARVTGLAANRAHSFRLCGRDDSSFPAVCAQTLAFKTAAAVEDSVTGSWFYSPHLTGTVDAHSGPAGQNPRGGVSDVDAPISYNAFQGYVTCLAVSGNKAAVGAVGQATLEDGQTKQPATLLLTIVDGIGGAYDSLGRDQEPGSTKPNCATASFDQQGSLGSGSDLIVNDAP